MMTIWLFLANTTMWYTATNDTNNLIVFIAQVHLGIVCMLYGKEK